MISSTCCNKLSKRFGSVAGAYPVWRFSEPTTLQATLTNASWNSTIAAGATVSGIGFNASYSGTNPPPTAFYVNGTLCH